MTIQDLLAKLADHQDLDRPEMVWVMQALMTGQLSQAQMGALLMGLRAKGESITEITAAAQVMRDLATPVHLAVDNAIDIVGTGGDGASIFNVSTASCFIVAAAGGFVAKHGNRGVSSSSGSADLLESAGINLQLSAQQVANCVQHVGLGFMFAPSHHQAMKNVISVRKELGMRTLFNVLGPLTNPAGVKRQLLGVYDQRLVRPLCEVLKNLGAQQVMVVASDDGLDELSLAAPTLVCELKDGVIHEYRLTPEDVGLVSQNLDGLAVASSQESLALIKDVFNSKVKTERVEKARAMLALNAGAAIYVADLCATLTQGVAMAEDAIYSGLAGEKLQQLVDYTEVFGA